MSHQNLLKPLPSHYMEVFYACFSNSLVYRQIIHEHKGDIYKCLHCKHKDQADRVAALNYARRFSDSDVGLYMPYSQVKTILLDRFHHRLETGQPVTVRT